MKEKEEENAVRKRKKTECVIKQTKIRTGKTTRKSERQR